MSAIDAISRLLDREGGEFTDRADDSGGPTKWGWTQSSISASLGRYVSVGELKALTRDQASDLYLREHWFRPGFNQIAAISERIAAELLDTHVNLPPARAGEFLQRALNALNDRRSLYPDVAVDGQCGPATRAALTAYLSRRREDVLLSVMNSQLCVYYLGRAEALPKNEANLYGWVINRVMKEA
jgi:lysozyme family protein